MAQIQFTPYVNQTQTISKPSNQDIFDIPIIKGNKKPKEEIVLAPLPQVKEPVVQTPTVSIDWNDSSRQGKSKSAREYLMKGLNLTKAQASGIIANLLSESGLNANAENTAEKAGKNSSVSSSQYGIGIGQWTGKRHNDYVNWVNSRGNSLQSQLDFAMDEMQRKYPEFLAALRTAETPEEASDYTYAMYTAANHRNVNKNNIQSIISGIERKYDAKHKEMYGKTFNNHSDRRRRTALEVMGYKTGGILKMQSGNKFGDQPSTKQPVVLVQEKPKGYQRQYNLLDSPRTQNDGFDKWYQYVSTTLGLDPNPDAPEHYYDYRSYYDDLVKQGKQYELITPDFSFPDTYKLPGHETFSIESKYYKPGMIAGHWEGNIYRSTPFDEEEMKLRQGWAESRFKSEKTSSAGAKGIYQFIPSTWNTLAKKYNFKGNIENPEDNEHMRDLYIDDLMHHDLIRFANEPSKVALAYAAYNMGIGNLKNFIEKEQSKGIDVYNTWDWIDDLNPRTKKYVNFIVRGIDGNGDLTTNALNKAKQWLKK